MTSSSGPARPVSPSNSFYALSDDEEGEYNTITHTASGKGVKLLFSKSKVIYSQMPGHAGRKCGVVILNFANVPTTGLYPSYTICERQHTWLHSSTPTETTSRLASYLLHVKRRQAKNSSFPPFG